MGPTAAGKTALAVRLAESLPADVVSVDSAMVYRGMDIGTGKPTPEVLARVPHRLIDIRDITEAYSAGDFRRDATREIAEIRDRGRIPLLVGGTGLYFRALERGLAPMPRASPEIRARIAEEGERTGWPALHARLAGVDPETARRIHPNDAQRIQRALEVFEVSGRGLSDWHHPSFARPGRLPGPVVSIALAPAERSRLHRAIDVRFRAMLDQGLVDEVRALARSPGASPDLPSMRAVGYRQVWEYLAVGGGYGAMVERALAATRQLARRQLTWLRACPGVRWVDPAHPGAVDGVREYILRNVERSAHEAGNRLQSGGSRQPEQLE